jgi:hypothetical protein
MCHSGPHTTYSGDRSPSPTALSMSVQRTSWPWDRGATGSTRHVGHPKCATPVHILHIWGAASPKPITSAGGSVPNVLAMGLGGPTGCTHRMSAAPEMWHSGPPTTCSGALHGNRSPPPPALSPASCLVYGPGRPTGRKRHVGPSRHVPLRPTYHI